MQSRNRYIYVVLLIIPIHTRHCRAAYFGYANQLTVYTMYKHSDMAITQPAMGTVALTPHILPYSPP